MTEPPESIQAIVERQGEFSLRPIPEAELGILDGAQWRYQISAQDGWIHIKALPGNRNLIGWLLIIAMFASLMYFYPPIYGFANRRLTQFSVVMNLMSTLGALFGIPFLIKELYQTVTDRYFRTHWFLIHKTRGFWQRTRKGIFGVRDIERGRVIAFVISIKRIPVRHVAHKINLEQHLRRGVENADGSESDYFVFKVWARFESGGDLKFMDFDSYLSERCYQSARTQISLMSHWLRVREIEVFEEQASQKK